MTMIMELNFSELQLLISTSLSKRYNTYIAPEKVILFRKSTDGSIHGTVETTDSNPNL